MALEITQSDNTKREVNDSWDCVSKLPCQISIDVMVSNFRVRDLGLLRVGKVLDSGWSLGKEVPVFANGSLLAWGQFEAVGHHLAVRLTDLAEG